MLKAVVVQDRLKRLKIFAFAFRLKGNCHLGHYPRVDELQEERGQVFTVGRTRRTIQLQRDGIMWLTLAAFIVRDAADGQTKPV